MTPSRVLELFDRLKVIIRNDHFIYTSEVDGIEMHGPTYVNKDGLYPYTTETSALCRELTNRSLYHLGGRNIDCVVGPEKGGIILSQWVGYFLTQMTGKIVLSVFAEKTKDAAGNMFFVFNRGYGDLVKDKNVLIVEDVVHTGESVKKVVDLVRQHGGNVRGVGSLCNRGGKAAAHIGVPYLFSLLDMAMESWMRNICLLCADNVPINTKFGKGKEYIVSSRE
jgi:orotate phosphoribosyltransferase